jgi:manganese transport protein
MSLAWVVVVGVIGIVLYAEMSGRVAAMSGRPVFDVIRERLGARVALADLVASLLINLMTVTAEIAGLALVIQLVTGVNHLLWVPMAAFAVWVVIWKVRFSVMEKVFGITGLLLVVTAVGVWKLQPDWSALLTLASEPARIGVSAHLLLLRHRVARRGHDSVRGLLLLVRGRGGALDPGGSHAQPSQRLPWVPIGRRPVARDHGGGGADLEAAGHRSRAPVADGAARGRDRGHDRPRAAVHRNVRGDLQRRARDIALDGVHPRAVPRVAVGEVRPAAEAARFHGVVLASVIVAVRVALTTIDPVKVTEYSIVFSAAALPLTYAPILIVANDPDYVGAKTNSIVANAIAFTYLILLVAVAVATIPLAIWTRAGA